MQYDIEKTKEEFNKLMLDIRQTVPAEFQAFIQQKEQLMKAGRITEKTKWLLLLISSVSQKCPVCVPIAVERCLRAGWTKEELLEASMVAVLVGGSSVMTFVTLVDKAIQQQAAK